MAKSVYYWQLCARLPVHRFDTEMLVHIPQAVKLIANRDRTTFRLWVSEWLEDLSFGELGSALERCDRM